MSDRFRADVIAAFGEPTERPLALAVSGGPDSMAMLVLAAAAFPAQVIAATVDHRLRPDAVGEAKMVADYCAANGIPHVTLSPATPIGTANVQANARDARYALLRDWAADADAAMLLTAHHLDDQAETLLMRLARGTGLPGLSAIRVRHDGAVPLIRPLLDWRRAELRAIVEAAGVPFVDDPSNADARFDRTRVRTALAAGDWLDPVALARSAAAIAEGEAALAALADRFWDERRTATGDGATLDVTGLPRDIRRRLARRALDCDANIEALLDALEAGGQASQGATLASASSDLWHFRPAPPRRSH